MPARLGVGTASPRGDELPGASSEAAKPGHFPRTTYPAGADYREPFLRSLILSVVFVAPLALIAEAPRVRAAGRGQWVYWVIWVAVAILALRPRWPVALRGAAVVSSALFASGYTLILFGFEATVVLLSMIALITGGVVFGMRIAVPVFIGILGAVSLAGLAFLNGWLRPPPPVFSDPTRPETWIGIVVGIITLMGALSFAILLLVQSLDRVGKDAAAAMLDAIASQGRLSQIIDFLPDATFVIDRDKRVIAWNRATEEMTGTPKDAIVGQGDYAYAVPFYGARRPVLIDLIGAKDLTSEPEYSFVERQGATLVAEAWVPSLFGGRGAHLYATASPLLDAEGRQVGAIESVRDVTARKRADEERARLQSEIAEAAAQWRATFDAVKAVLVLTSLTGTVKRCNAAARHLVGRQWAEILDQPIASLGEGEPWRSADLLVARAAAGTTTQEISAEAPGRTWSIEAVRFGESSDSVIVTMHDVTTLMELQESLRRRENMAAMGALVGGVAHEVRNPLFGISSLLDAFDATLQSSEELSSFGRGLRQETDRLTGVMQALLEYGRPVSEERIPMSLEVILGEAVQLCRRIAAERGINLTLSIPEALPSVPMDRTRMLGVFRNLVENGIQHSPAGGSVALAARLDPKRNAWIEVQVRDSGPGFPEGERERVFEPFFSRRSGGTGLGLSIVHRVVGAHGGEVRASNHPDGGGLVTVCVPL
jgi:signal transduction histidine kinase